MPQRRLEPAKHQEIEAEEAMHPVEIGLQLEGFPKRFDGGRQASLPVPHQPEAGVELGDVGSDLERLSFAKTT